MLRATKAAIRKTAKRRRETIAVMRGQTATHFRQMANVEARYHEQIFAPVFVLMLP